MAESKEPRKLIANNKKARHDYFLDEFYEAGIELFGTEVKSMRLGKCSIKEAFVRIDNGEIYIYQMHISPYEQGNIFNKDPLRPRKLLLHKRWRSTSSPGRSRWRLPWPEERSSTTSGRILRPGI